MLTMIAIATALLEVFMPLTTIAKGGVSHVMEPREVVIRSAEDWTTLWRAHAGEDADPPGVDFGASMVVGVFLGARNTAGYAVDIDAVEAEGAGAVVTYTVTTPGRGMMLAQVITSPFHLASVSRTPGPVRFERTEKAGR